VDGASLLDLFESLKTVPSELEYVYLHILTNVVELSQHPKSLHLMQWIFLAEMPLSVADLRFAIASDDRSLVSGQNSCHDSKEFISSDSRMITLINSLTGGLAEVSSPLRYMDNITTYVLPKRAVQFIHKSVGHFLTKNQFGCFGKLLVENPIGQSHHRLAQSCINYLKMEGFKLKDKEQKYLEAIPFLGYAIRFWFIHAGKAESHGVSQQGLVALFEWPSDKTIRSWIQIYRKIDSFEFLCPKEGSTLLHVAARSGLRGTIQELVDRGENLEEMDEGQNTALHYAVVGGHESVVRMLLAANAYPGPTNARGSTPLIQAAEAGHEAIVQLLLNAGADVKAQDANYALQAAAGLGSEAVVKLLLRAGADVNAQCGYFGTALQAAASGSGSEAILRLLLDAGADVNAQGGYYGNALQAAASIAASEAVVKLLLDAGAYVNALGGYNGSALQAAASLAGSEVVVRLLLDAGADVNAPGGNFGNALQAAAFEEGSEVVVKLLLDAGADVNAPGGKHGDALQVAAKADSEAVVKLLLDAGADVNAEPGYYGSALQAAGRAGSKAVVKLLLDAGARPGQ